MGRRSNLILGLGLAVFVVGAVATFLIVRGHGDAAPAAGSGRISVLVATKAIPAGTQGSVAFNQGLVGTKAVSARSKPATAFADPSQLAGKTSAVGLAEGQVLTSEQFQATQTRIGTLKIPDGKTALAVQMANVAGVAGFAGAGDRIDVYGVVKAAGDNKGSSVRLIMQNTEVLNVNGAALAPTPGQPGGVGLVYLLAVTPAEAERLVYLTSFEQLYFSLVPKDQPAVPGTAGSSPADVLK